MDKIVSTTHSFHLPANYNDHLRLLDNGGFSILSLSSIQYLFKNRIVSCILKLRKDPDYSFPDAHSIKIYQKNSDNSLELIDIGESESDYFVLDITRYVFLKNIYLQNYY